MKRSYAYILSALGISAAIFGGMAIAQQKPAVPAAAPVAAAVPVALVAPAAPAAVTPAPAFDIKSVQSLPVGLERGQKIAAAVCIACHNADGNSTVPLQPKLAGQHEAYIIKQLYDFKKVEGAQYAARNNAIMGGQVAGLSAEPAEYDKDVKSLAAWFAAQKQIPATAVYTDDVTDEADPKLSALGVKIFKGGILSKGVPACAACHGPTGAGIPNKYPRVSGQFGDYLEVQLKHFRDDKLDGGRRNNEAMQDIAKRLTDTEIRAVADYMAGVR